MKIITLKKTITLKVMLVLLVMLNSVSVFAQINLDWQRNVALEEGLPPSIKVFEIFTLPDGTPLHAIYAEVDLTDPNIVLSTAYSPGTAGFKTPSTFAAEETEPDYVTINGGYFSSNASVSLVIQNGQLLSPGTESVAGPLYPSRGAFGVDASGTPDVTWTYNVGAAQTTYSYPQPNPDHNVQPTATYPEGGEIWNVVNAIGAGPVLVENGSAKVFSQEELTQLASTNTKEPRTAIGYTAGSKAILMVVDGRQVGFSVGITLLDLAQVMVELNCLEALNLDGGGSSAMVIADKLASRPSDAGNVQRSVPSVFMVKRKLQIYDTEFPENYSEVGDGWFETGLAGFYGSSKSRLIETGDGSKKATYTFADLPPAQYEVSGWWVAFANRSPQTPFTIVRPGIGNDTIRVNQTTGANQFNNIGTFHLSGNDIITVSNNAPGAFITTDAIQLKKVGESFPTVTFSGAEARDLVQGQVLEQDIILGSPNTGVTLETLKIFKTDINGAESQLGGDIDLEGQLLVNYPFSYQLVDDLGTISFRFEILDNFGRTVSKTLIINIKAFEIQLNPPAEAVSVEANTTYAVTVSADTQNEEQVLSTLNIFEKVNDAEETLLVENIPLEGTADSYAFSYLVKDKVTDSVQLRFEVVTEQEAVVDKLLNLSIIPERGDFRIAVISDFNASFGSTEYEFQVDSIVQRIPRLWSPDLVIAGGDMVAGQSTALTDEQLRAMWDAFDAKIATPFRESETPFIFTVGNHDASKSPTFVREQAIMAEYWAEPQTEPKWFPINMDNYPFYYSAMDKEGGDIFIVSWDASASYFSDVELQFVRDQFTSPEAEAAKVKLLVGHLPLYGVAQERDTPGNVLDNPMEIQSMLEELGVHTYISGHHHAYYPGKHGSVDLLNAGIIGSGPRKLLNTDEVSPRTTTLMDFFFERDSVVYTTYEITQNRAEDMKLFDEKGVQPIINGINGYIIRRDIELKNQGNALPLGINIVDENAPDGASANIDLTVNDGTALFNGAFLNLASPLLESRDAIAVYSGQHTETGRLLGTISASSTDGKTGTINGQFPVTPEFRELLSAGSLYVLIKTIDKPEGALRSQIYVPSNTAPTEVEITSPSQDSIVAVRNVLAILPITWAKAKDADQNPVTYSYQLARDTDLTDVAVNAKTGRSQEYRAMTEGDFYALLGDAAEGEVMTFYHRVVITDGKNVTISPTQQLKLAKSNAPVIGAVEIPAPNYEFDGVIGQAPASNGHGVTVDENGRVWTVAYSYGIKVYNPNGTSFVLTSDKLTYNGNDTSSYVSIIKFKGIDITISKMRGLGKDSDGNILVVVGDSNFFKLDKNTGAPLAYWDGPTSLTNPSSDDSGRVFVASVVGDRQFILKQNLTDPTTYDVLVGGADADMDGKPDGFSLPGRSLARSSFISPEGNRIYVPANSTSNIFAYTSDNGVDFELDEILDSGFPTGTNSVFAGAGETVWFVANRGTEAPKLTFRDFANQLSWTLPLEDVPSFDLRGLSFTQNRDTLYVVGSDNGQIIRYRKPVVDAPIDNIATYSVDEVNEVNAAGNADFAGEYARVLGTVNSLNLSENGLDFSMEANGEGIVVTNPSSQLGYALMKNDSLAVVGRIKQEYGQLLIVADSLRVLAGSRPIADTKQVTEFVNENESVNNTVSEVQFDDVSQWGAGEFRGLTLTARNADGSYEIFVDRQSPLFAQPAPELGTTYTITGILRQFKLQPPFANDGFSLYAQELDDIMLGIDTSVIATGFVAYPNPVRDTLNLRFDKSLPTSVKIYTLNGKLIRSINDKDFQGSSVQVDVSGLSAGVYLLKVGIGVGEQQILKLIKK